MPRLKNLKRLVTIKDYQKYIQIKKSSNPKLDSIFTKEEIIQLENFSQTIGNILIESKFFSQLSRQIQGSLALETRKLVEEVTTINNTFRTVSLPTTQFLSGLRVVHDAFVNLSINARISAEIFTGFKKLFTLISDILISNANTIKSLASFIEDAQTKKMKASLFLLKLDFSNIFPDIDKLIPPAFPFHSEEVSLQIEPKQSRSPVIIYCKDVFLELQGDTVTIKTNEDEVIDFNEANKRLSLNKQQNLLLPPSGVIPTLSISIVEVSSKEIYFLAEGYERSSIVRKKVAWVRVFEAYIRSEYILRQNHILQVWNNTNKHRFDSTNKRSGRQKDYIPTIHRQIISGMKKSYPPIVKLMNFRFIESGFHENSYKLEIHQQTD